MQFWFSTASCIPICNFLRRNHYLWWMVNMLAKNWCNFWQANPKASHPTLVKEIIALWNLNEIKWCNELLDACWSGMLGIHVWPKFVRAKTWEEFILFKRVPWCKSVVDEFCSQLVVSLNNSEEEETNSNKLLWRLSTSPRTRKVAWSLKPVTFNFFRCRVS